jgi:hypothetical protein
MDGVETAFFVYKIIEIAGKSRYKRYYQNLLQRKAHILVCEIRVLVNNLIIKMLRRRKILMEFEHSSLAPII